MNKIDCVFKAGIIGCGNVGATTAYNFLLSGTVTDLVLFDLNYEKSEGLTLDLEHALPFTPHTNVSAAKSIQDLNGCNVVIITAGKRQQEGETRLDLAKANKEIFANLVPQIAAAAPHSIIINVTNPLDVLTYQALKSSGFPANRVFGSGTILDTARLQFHISEKIGVHPGSINAYILGEHGDTSFPVYSSATVGGKPLMQFDNFDEKIAENCYQDTKNAAYRIIHDQGFTCYSIATALREITTAIFENSFRILPVSVMLNNYYGHSDVCLSVPCAIGRNGIEKIIDIPLDQKEQKMLAKSVETIKSFL